MSYKRRYVLTSFSASEMNRIQRFRYLRTLAGGQSINRWNGYTLLFENRIYIYIYIYEWGCAMSNCPRYVCTVGLTQIDDSIYQTLPTSPCSLNPQGGRLRRWNQTHMTEVHIKRTVWIKQDVRFNLRLPRLSVHRYGGQSPLASNTSNDPHDFHGVHAGISISYFLTT